MRWSNDVRPNRLGIDSHTFHVLDEKPVQFPVGCDGWTPAWWFHGSGAPNPMAFGPPVSSYECRPPDGRLSRLLRARRQRPRRRRAAECDQQLPPSDGDCHTPLPREVRKHKDTTPRACSLKKGRMACFVGLRRGETLPSRCNQPAASSRLAIVITMLISGEPHVSATSTISIPPRGLRPGMWGYINKSWRPPVPSGRAPRAQRRLRHWPSAARR